MQYFQQIAAGMDVAPLLESLKRQPELFDVYKERRLPHGEHKSPHHDMTDIWLRHNDRRPFESGQIPWTKFNDPHDPVWYPAHDKLPEARPLIFDVMRMTQAEHLGGILITKLPPGKSIAPHIDRGWHAEAHEKFMVYLQCDDRMAFGFPENRTIIAKPGDCWEFRNDIYHWITNQSDIDRIVMIISIRRQKDAAWTV